MDNLDYIRKNKESYGCMAPFYRTKRERGDFKIYPDIIEFSDLLEEHFQNSRVLDIGPGAGVILHYFSQRGFRTTAIDISKEMINVAREKSPETKYLLGNFLGYNFNSREFEGLFAKAILHLFTKEDATAFIKKSYELMVSNGLFYLSLFIRNESKEDFMLKNMDGRKFIRYNKYWTLSELECLLNNSSFEVVHTFSVPHGTMKKWSGILKKHN